MPIRPTPRFDLTPPTARRLEWQGPGRLSFPLAALTALTLAACGGLPERNPRLDQARAAYSVAESDPLVVRNAPLELKRAEEALNAADARWREKEDMETVDHYAYLAERQAEIAREAARQKAAEEAIGQAGAERAQAQLQARTQEAMSAQQAAEARAREAEFARAQAQREAQAAQAARQAAMGAEARARELQAQIEELKAKQTDRGLVLTLGDVLFDTGRANLRPAADDAIGKLADFLQRYPERTVLIEGHTDSVGSDLYNQQLSEDRANAVRTALLERGVAPERVSARGYGETRPVAGNDDASGRQLNRRVEVIIPNAPTDAGTTAQP